MRFRSSRRSNQEVQPRGTGSSGDLRSQGDSGCMDVPGGIREVRKSWTWHRTATSNPGAKTNKCQHVKIPSSIYTYCIIVDFAVKLLCLLFRNSITFSGVCQFLASVNPTISSINTSRCV